MLKTIALVLSTTLVGGLAADAATTKVRPDLGASAAARFKLNNARVSPSFGKFRQPLNQLNPQPLPPAQMGRLNRADPLNPQPLPPAPPPQGKFAVPKVLPAATSLRSR